MAKLIEVIVGDLGRTLDFVGFKDLRKFLKHFLAIKIIAISTKIDKTRKTTKEIGENMAKITAQFESRIK